MRSKPVLTVRAAASRARKFATRLACVALVFGSTSSAHVRGVPQEAQAPSSYALIDQALAAGRDHGAPPVLVPLRYRLLMP